MLDMLSLQLWSIKDCTEKDFAGTIEKIAKMGYKGVEFAGYGGLSAKDMKSLLQANGITPVSTHTGYDTLVDSEKLKAEIEYINEIGGTYIVCPGADINSKENTLRIAEQFNEIARKCNDEGLQFGYHNHDFEFKKADDKFLLDILYENTDTNVLMELDVFWAVMGGVNPLEYLKDWYPRPALLHLKQIDKEMKGINVNAGDGAIDFAELIKYGKYHGIKAFVYEQEEYEVSSMESVEKSAQFLLSLKE